MKYDRGWGAWDIYTGLGSGKPERFYEQTNGVAMGSPLSPVIAIFYMEDFERKAIEKATHKPSCWYRYVDDTFVIWPHGKEKLMDFLKHLNGIHNNIQFTMEMEREGHLPFLDIDIYRKINAARACLNPVRYEYPTHPNPCHTSSTCL